MDGKSLYFSLQKTVLLILGIVIFFWFVVTARLAFLLLLSGFVFTIALNPVVVNLRKIHLSRLWATLLITGIFIVLVAVLLWLLIPRVVQDVSNLLVQLPKIFSSIRFYLQDWVKNYPFISSIVKVGEQQQRLTLQKILTFFSSYSFSLLDFLVDLLFFFSVIVYSLVNPEPLTKGYLLLFPKKYEKKAELLLQNTFRVIRGWMWANVVIGCIQGIAVFFFLSFLSVPAVLLWAVLSFVSQFIPRFGAYIAAIPPIVIALTLHPITALWVLIFYIVLNEITGDFIYPYISSSETQMNPVLIIFVTFALYLSFGLVGALIAVPFSGFLLNVYREFFKREPTTQTTKRSKRLYH